MQHCKRTYEITKICRCCLNHVGEMKSLYGFSLDEMLRSVADMEVTPNDGLPELMCFQCVLQLSRAFRFKEQCRKSETIIRNQIVNESGEDRKSIHTEKEVFESLNSHKLFEGTSATESGNNGENNECYIVSEDDFDCSSIVQDDNESETGPSKKEDSYQTTGCTESMNIINSNTTFKCGTCSKEFSVRKQLVRHIKTHDDNKPYKCTECDKTFAERCNLKKHLLKHTGELRNTTNKPHLCSICGNSFKYSSSLSKHMKFHTGKNLLYCLHCPKYFVEKSALEIHLRSHTGDRPHVCHQCDRRFTQACNLQKHLRSHSGERPFKCPICERSFREHDYVAVHMQTHNSEKKSLCSVCGKRFASSKTLDAHMRTHTEKRSYICGYKNCNKTFTRLDTALVHRRIHSGEKPYSCNECSHSFTTSTQLSNHLRTHTGEKPFACERCPKKFASRNSLKSHSNKHTDPQPAVNEIVQKDQQQGNTTYDQDAFQQKVLNCHEESITKQIYEESVLLFKLNKNGELVPETGCVEMSALQ